MTESRPRPIHPAWLRAMHWLNALAVVVLTMSGWRIYNATAFLGFVIPADITLGAGLAGPCNDTLPPCGYWPSTAPCTSR